MTLTKDREYPTIWIVKESEPEIMGELVERRRLIVIDLLRILSALIIFLFHSNIHIACTYGIFTPFISRGNLFMTAFFMLSGFSLFYMSRERNEIYKDNKKIFVFYKRRFINIIPMYWFIVLTYPFFDVLVNKNSLKDNLLLAPVEILGIQNAFHSLFDYTHNGGTWFISCIFFCYFIFPFLFNILSETTKKAELITMLFITFILLYAPFLTDYFGIESMYENLLFRLAEFVTGMLLCSVWFKVRNEEWYIKYISNGIFCFLFLIILFAGVMIFARSHMAVANDMLSCRVGLPCFAGIIFCGAGLEAQRIPKVVEYMADISYVFFLAQFYTWKLTMWVIQKIGYDTNLHKIVISFLICLILTVVMHECIEKPLKKVFSKFAGLNCSC